MTVGESDSNDSDTLYRGGMRRHIVRHPRASQREHTYRCEPSSEHFKLSYTTRKSTNIWVTRVAKGGRRFS